ncbi:Acetolactate synthase large subunit [subsurface metagenome]
MAELGEQLKTPAGAQPGELELDPNPGGWLKDVFLEQGVTHFFGVYGGHMWAFIDPAIKAGIKHITVRHEEQAAYMAEAYARTTAGLGSVKPGVCCGTVGPGSTNLVSGVHQAYWSTTPMVVVVAGHESDHDGVYTLQECYAAEIYKPFTKWTKRLIDNATYKRYFTKALHDSQIPTRGPVLLEFEVNQMLSPPHGVLMFHDPPNQFGYKPGWLKQPISPAYPNPQDVERAVKLIYEAERPCVFSHDGALWNDIGPELVEFCELAQIPAMTRRGGRGAMPENNPLTCKAGSLIDESDLMCLIGGKLDFYDFWGIRWKIDKTLQINDDQELIHPWLPTEVGIVANAKVTLRMMIDCAKSNGYKVREDRAKWIARIQEMEKGRVALWERRAQQFKDDKPLHACWISKIISDVSEEMYRGRVPAMFDS